MRLALILLTATLVLVIALLAAAGAGKLARLDGATYPTAFSRAASTFTAVVSVAAVVTATFTALVG
ncbi:hypothetical protein [Streptomyces sp. NPDC091278]|uniref:hypothetical protein n=1 Tax=unclassified Streptomyces TaxID=2593676 RepID=UPI0034504C92